MKKESTTSTAHPQVMPPASVQSGVPLHTKNWFQTGGAAEWYTQPQTVSQLQEALSWAEAHQYPVTMLGTGANVLISDAGVRGLTVTLGLTQITHHHANEHTVHVTAEAGVIFQELIDYCLNNQIGGLEEFSGIPGTVGGSVYINIHYFQFLLSQYLESAVVIDKTGNTILQVTHDWFHFGYNSSKLIGGAFYLVSATFRLTPLSLEQAAYARGRRDEIVRHRKQRYPYERTCGSFFRNFTPDEISCTSNEQKIIFVAYYLETLGLKGAASIGGAQVSHKHANMIVTTPGATSADIVTLARHLQERVYRAFGIVPQPECQFLGFAEYPLHTQF